MTATTKCNVRSAQLETKGQTCHINGTSRRLNIQAEKTYFVGNGITCSTRAPLAMEGIMTELPAGVVGDDVLSTSRSGSTIQRP